jgi:hypothetical protein
VTADDVLRTRLLAIMRTRPLMTTYSPLHFSPCASNHDDGTR